MTHGYELRWGNAGGGGVCRVEGNKRGGGEWDNCNSIINKIYFKKIKKDSLWITFGLMLNMAQLSGGTHIIDSQFSFH